MMGSSFPIKRGSQESDDSQENCVEYLITETRGSIRQATDQEPLGSARIRYYNTVTEQNDCASHESYTYRDIK